MLLRILNQKQKIKQLSIFLILKNQTNAPQSFAVRYAVNPY